MGQLLIARQKLPSLASFSFNRNWDVDAAKSPLSMDEQFRTQLPSRHSNCAHLRTGVVEAVQFNQLGDTVIQVELAVESQMMSLLERDVEVPDVLVLNAGIDDLNWNVSLNGIGDIPLGEVELLAPHVEDFAAH